MEDDYTHKSCQRWILSATNAVVARPGYGRAIVCHVRPGAGNQRRQNETATISEYQDDLFLGFSYAEFPLLQYFVGILAAQNCTL